MEPVDGTPLGPESAGNPRTQHLFAALIHGGTASGRSPMPQDMRRFLSFGPAFVVLLTAIVTLILIPGAIRGITAATTHANVTLAQQSLDQDDVLERMNPA